MEKRRNKLYGGLIVTVLETERAEAILERIHRERKFTVAVSSRDHHPKEMDSYLISLDGKTLEFICLGRVGSGIVTESRRVTLFSLVDLSALRLEDLDLSDETKAKIADALGREAYRLPGEVWPTILIAIKKARPQVATAINDLENIRTTSRKTINYNASMIVAEERDSAGLAAKIFGLKQEDVFERMVPTAAATPIPFLNQMRHHVMYEDAMLMNDWLTLPQWRFLGKTKFAAAQFEKNGEVLTIFNVNKMPLEHCLGADLIYYHHHFNSFVLVQYKRLDRKVGNWQFDLNDKQFQKQALQMNCLQTQFLLNDTVGDCKDYRLGNECCFFKFCKSQTDVAPHSPELIEGMYVTSGYLSLLKVAPETAGPLGGRILNYENVGRHMNNTDFVSLVSHGWVGSRNVASDFLSKVVSECVEEGRSVTFAWSRQMTELEQIVADERKFDEQDDECPGA